MWYHDNITSREVRRVVNGTMLQCFEWELPADGSHWRLLRKQAHLFRRLGITAVWMPPAYKGCGGVNDVGYGVYDLYDLGEFPQKGATRTKYGTRGEYLSAVRALRRTGLQVLADVVLNHRMGADESEDVDVTVEDPHRRGLPDRPTRRARLFTRFTFTARKGRYSAFAWDHRHFTGTDWDEQAGESGVFRIAGKTWAQDVDDEKGNYDYLMGCDVDVQSPEVQQELLHWGRWYIDQTGVDGFRLDAVKHISASFYRMWLAELRKSSGRELFSVGEYWHCDVRALHRYLGQVGECMSLFDVPLHDRFRRVSISGGQFNMATLFDDTLVGTKPHLAVTFVDNHDTQPGQSLQSWVEGWFKASAYGLILLRAFGYPCVFWGDLMGIPSRNIGKVPELPTLLSLRRWNAHGRERDYFDHHTVIGFTRAGDASVPGSGLAFLVSDGDAGFKTMEVGRRFAGRTFRCVLGDCPDVTIDAEGCGLFTVGAGRCSVFIPKLTAREAAWLALQKAKAALYEEGVHQLTEWEDRLIPPERHRG